ncbi:MAG: rhodanese-like domain-containing protein [Anaerolineae bacterium]|nr:rhodanese-like domain-containing protein [Anaerolineae bacterium]
MKKMILLLLTLVTISACQSQPDVTGEVVTIEGGSYKNISAGELNSMFKNKDFILVNVHIPFAGDIPNTDVSIPFDQITESSYLSQLPTDKNAKIVLYCRSGRMSQIASEKLVGLGYANIWNLRGGMDEWEQSGYDLK